MQLTGIPFVAKFRKRGAVAPLVAVLLVVILGFAALSIDAGVIFNARVELQSSADAAALAAAWQLLDEEDLNGEADSSEEIAAARAEAVVRAAANAVGGLYPVVDLNTDNAIDGDIVVGYLDDITDPDAAMTFVDPNEFNTVRVRVHRDNTRNGPLTLFFARVLGIETAEVSAVASATFKDGVVGFKVTETTGNAGMLPFALKVDKWNELLDGVSTTGDDWAYDEDTGTVSAGTDNIDEMNLYPGAGAEQLPPGNFGTVDIGNPNNSTADLTRQINEGVNADDLAYFGGEFKLGPDGTLVVTGDTGLSAGIKDDLAAVIGQPRTILLFSSVSGNGNNSEYTIVGFAGIRIMEVVLTGKMSDKRVIIQPAFVVDDAVITESGSGPSHFIYQPVVLSE